MARTVQSRVRDRRAKSHRRAFSLVELLIVVAIIGIIAAIAGAQVSKTFRRAKVDTVADAMRNFIQEAGSQVQKQNLPVFVELSRVAAPPPGFYRLQSISDSRTNSQLDGPYNTMPVGDPANDATKDTILATYDVPSDIVLSIVNGSQIDTAFWSTNTADTSTRQLLCDFQHRTIDPSAISGRQIAGVATLSVSHADMVRTTGKLTPLVNDQIRINPIWSAHVLRTVQ